MRRVSQYLGQAAALAVFGVIVAVFADTPRYTHVVPENAVVQLSIVHNAKREGECRRRTEQELAELAPNMRNPLDCPRGRLPITVELAIDSRQVFAVTAPPTGLAGDGPSRVHERFVLPAGTHRLSVRMRDTAREIGFDYEAERTVNLAPRQKLVIDFKAEAGGLVFE